GRDRPPHVALRAFLIQAGHHRRRLSHQLRSRRRIRGHRLLHQPVRLVGQDPDQLRVTTGHTFTPYLLDRAKPEPERLVDPLIENIDPDSGTTRTAPVVLV